MTGKQNETKCSFSFFYYYVGTERIPSINAGAISTQIFSMLLPKKAVIPLRFTTFLFRLLRSPYTMAMKTPRHERSRKSPWYKRCGPFSIYRTIANALFPPLSQLSFFMECQSQCWRFMWFCAYLWLTLIAWKLEECHWVRQARELSRRSSSMARSER